MHDWSLKREKTYLKHESGENPTGKTTQGVVSKHAIVSISASTKELWQEAPTAVLNTNMLQALGTAVFPTHTFYI